MKKFYVRVDMYIEAESVEKAEEMVISMVESQGEEFDIVDSGECQE